MTSDRSPRTLWDRFYDAVIAQDGLVDELGGPVGLICTVVVAVAAVVALVVWLVA